MKVSQCTLQQSSLDRLHFASSSMSNRSEVFKLVQKDALFCPKPVPHDKMQSLRERSLLTATTPTTTTSDTLSL
eukprot:724960-Amphidinium_carterae.1